MSCRPKSRPLTSGMPMTLKYPGRTILTTAVTSSPGADCGRPSMMNRDSPYVPFRGSIVAVVNPPIRHLVEQTVQSIAERSICRTVQFVCLLRRKILSANLIIDLFPRQRDAAKCHQPGRLIAGTAIVKPTRLRTSRVAPMASKAASATSATTSVVRTAGPVCHSMILGCYLSAHRSRRLSMLSRQESSPRSWW